MIAVVAAVLAHVPAHCTDKRPVTFERVSMGEIDETAATKAGFHTQGWSYAHFGFTSFKASNGKGLVMMYDDFQNTEDARRFLDWKVGRSFKVISQSTKTSPNSKAIEYHAELVPGADNADVDVIWIVGAAVHWIHARALEDALDFEKQYRR